MENFDYIEKNLTGNSSEDDYQAFKQRIASDKDFALEVHFYMNAKKAIQSLDTNSMLIEKPEENNVRPIYKNKFMWVAAASIFLLLGVWIFNQPKTVEPGTLMNVPSPNQSPKLSDSLKKDTTQSKRVSPFK